MDEVYAAKVLAEEELTKQACVFTALQRLENLIDTMEETVFGPKELAYPPEAPRETVGIAKAMDQFLTRLEAGLYEACNNLTNIQTVLSSLPNQGYKGSAR